MDDIYSDPNLHLLDRFRAAGIDIISPHYSVMMNQAAAHTGPANPQNPDTPHSGLEQHAHPIHPHVDPHTLGLD